MPVSNNQDVARCGVTLWARECSSVRMARRALTDEQILLALLSEDSQVDDLDELNGDLEQDENTVETNNEQESDYNTEIT